jgi:hypothetical protein
MQRVFATWLIVIICIFACFSSNAEGVITAPGNSVPAPTPTTVKIISKPNYTRLLFYNTPLQDFDISSANQRLTIETGRKISTNLDKLISNLSDYIRSLALNEAGTGFFIRLKDQYSVRKIVGRDFVGVDVVPVPKKLDPQSIKVTYEPTATSSNTTASTLVATQEKKKNATNTQRKKPESLSNKTQKPTANHANNPIIGSMSFAFDTPVKSAIFVRAGYLWAIFDQFKQFKKEQVLLKASNIVDSIEAITNRNYTVLRMKLKHPDAYPSVIRQGNTVSIQFLKHAFTVPNENEPEITLASSILHGSSITLNLNESTDILQVTDPLVGDTLLILPVENAQLFIQHKRTYQDYNIIQTAAGIAVQLKSDDVQLQDTNGNITLAGPTNRLASNAQAALIELREKERLARLRAKKEMDAKHELTLLKFNNWAGDKNISFDKNLEKFLWAVIEADWDKKLVARLNLARFYLVNLLGAEAHGVLEVIKEYNPDATKTNNYKMLEGTALYLMHRYQGAAAAFDDMDTVKYTLEEQNEWKFWLSAASFRASRELQIDSFINKNPTEEKKKSDEVDISNKVEVTRLVLETSERLLKLIKDLDEDFATNDEVETLESTARFVSSHYQEVINNFKESELFQAGGTFEAEDKKLWWGLSKGKPSEKFEFNFKESKDEFLRNYPDALYNDLAITALEERLNIGDLNSSDYILANLRAEKRPHILNNITFLKGLLFAKDENIKKASALWKELANNTSDRFNRARAGFALTSLLLDNKMITIPEAIDNFNKLRISWRGDIIELSLLQLIGDLYINQKQYMKGFRVWRELVSYFPGTEQALLTARKMSQTFVQLFNQGDADQLPIINALTLYYEFRELTPIGKQGDEMISKLADRLIQVDLLDKAAGLLTHQVRFRLQGEKRDLASTKLAEVHMMNNKPQLAYDVLTATTHENIVPDLAVKRKYLAANALISLNRNNRALVLLKSDYSQKASFLRSQIYWNKKVWNKVVEELQPTFRDLRREETTLSDQETDYLLKLAVAYAILEKKKRLQILYEDFNPFIANTDKRDVLQFVASDQGPINYQDLDYSVGIKSIQKFLDEHFKSSPQAKAIDDIPNQG